MMSRNQIGNREQGTGNESPRFRASPFPVRRSPFPPFRNHVEQGTENKSLRFTPFPVPRSPFPLSGIHA
jgi:hypothetical protein